MASAKAAIRATGRDMRGDLSVAGKMFGFWHRRVPDDGGTADRREVSMTHQIGAIKGRYIDLNVIAVGWYNEFSDAERRDAMAKIDFAILRCREILAIQRIGIRMVQVSLVNRDEADGLDDIKANGDADDLYEAWSGPENRIDCFVVRTISGGWLGESPTPGSAVRNARKDGLIAGAIDRTSWHGFARTFAHEIGHYLGLPHTHGEDDCPSTRAGSNNLMAQTGCATTPPGIGVEAAVLLTSTQGSTMRGHGLVRHGVGIIANGV